MLKQSCNFAGNRLLSTRAMLYTKKRHEENLTEKCLSICGFVSTSSCRYGPGRILFRIYTPPQAEQPVQFFGHSNCSKRKTRQFRRLNEKAGQSPAWLMK